MLQRHSSDSNDELTSDTERWDAIASAGKLDLIKMPAAEKICVIHRLLNGYGSDDDLAAIEKLCKDVSTTIEMQQINRAGHRAEGELNDRQARRFHDAVNRDVGGAP